MQANFITSLMLMIFVIFFQFDLTFLMYSLQSLYLNREIGACMFVK